MENTVGATLPYPLQHIRLVLMPLIVTAGEYALRIQQQIRSRPSKEYDNPFAQALTDADLAVQNFFEVALLAQLPELSFFGEENEQSLSSKYFPATAPLMLLLDPIDGTRFYADGKPDFNIVISAVDRSWYRAGFIYMPAHQLCIHALEGENTRVLEEDDLLYDAPGRPLTFDGASRRIVAYRCPEAKVLESAGFEVIDVAEAYDIDPDCPNVNAIFRGQACAFIGKNNSAIDWGVHAFLVQQAGGAASDWQGSPLPELSTLGSLSFPEMVVSTDPQIHEQIISILNRR